MLLIRLKGFSQQQLPDPFEMLTRSQVHSAAQSDTLKQELRQFPDWLTFKAIKQRLCGGLKLPYHARTAGQLLFETVANVAPTGAAWMAESEY